LVLAVEKRTLRLPKFTSALIVAVVARTLAVSTKAPTAMPLKVAVPVLGSAVPLVGSPADIAFRLQGPALRSVVPHMPNDW
jgi:hypothetical protein